MQTERWCVKLSFNEIDFKKLKQPIIKRIQRSNSNIFSQPRNCVVRVGVLIRKGEIYKSERLQNIDAASSDKDSNGDHNFSLMAAPRPCHGKKQKLDTAVCVNFFLTFSTTVMTLILLFISCLHCDELSAAAVLKLLRSSVLSASRVRDEIDVSALHELQFERTDSVLGPLTQNFIFLSNVTDIRRLTS